ncbi:hypothetical protein MMC25_004226 [Agyrium rufum]|nr:hypothetical protein [Agyrium rufum]
MSSADGQHWLTALLSPTPLAILFTVTLALTIPLFLHFVIYRTSANTTLPTFLLLGPAGAGKTSLLTLFERGKPTSTHTSQTPLSVEVSLPITTATASTRYRSQNDPSLQVHKRFLLIDTPGHGKLRHHAYDSIVKPQNLKGLIFVVDAANLAPESPGLREAAEYLHDMLLSLQRRTTSIKTSRVPGEIAVLIAANKVDLFTALPAPLVRLALEAEITKVRSSRSAGLLDSGIGVSDDGPGEEQEVLGEGGDGKFEFRQMEEANVDVQILGGCVVSEEGPDVSKWWDWIGGNL